MCYNKSERGEKMAKGTHRRLSIRFKIEIYEQLALLADELGVGVGTVAQWIIGNYLRSVRQVEPQVMSKLSEVLGEVLRSVEDEDKSVTG